MKPITRAIIVLDQTSGTLREDEGRVLGLDLSPSVAALAADSLAGGIELVLAVPGLAEAGFDGGLDAFAGGIAVVPIGPLSHAGDAGLAALADGAGDDGTTALVSADRRLRGEARAAGLVPAAHPALLPMLAKGDDVAAARVAGPRGALERLAAGGGVVPMQFQPVPGGDGSGDWALFGLFAPDRLIAAVLGRLTVVPLPYDPQTEDLVWVRIDHADDEVRAALAGRRILYAEPGQVLVALGPDDDAEAIHAHGEHGHSEFLAPDPGLLAPPAGEEGDFEADPGKAPPEIFEPVVADPVRRRLILWARPRCKTVAAQYTTDLDRYAGVTPLDAAGTIVSRHSAHPDNKRAETQLLADLRAMGYCAYRHNFVHAGATHSNIIADLPGAGRLRIRPEIIDRLRKILREPVIRRPLGRLPSGLEGLMPEGTGFADFDDLPDEELRRLLERVLQLRPWYPWWKLRCPLPGWGAGLVIVGAHMDSTAGFEPGYSAPTDPAPGRDDNGSGLAGVLSLARHFRSLAGQLTHTLRFCFFNAEESGLVGSKAYAAHLKAMGAPVRATVCMDMIGYNSDANQLFEVHAGYTDPAVRDLSLPFADRVAQAAAAYGTLAPAQVYKGTGYGGAPDRNIFDGAINRSDHAAFHQQGWGAVLVSEDFFVNLASEPGADPNPNYHRAADQTTDAAYARAIVCAIARAVTQLAA